MNTGTRRFLLRLAVGLLAFLLGVTAAWALGAFNPFQESRSYRHYNSSGSLGVTPEPSVVYPVYRYEGHGCRSRERFREMPPPPPAPRANAPMPPSPPQPLR